MRCHGCSILYVSGFASWLVGRRSNLRRSGVRGVSEWVWWWWEWEREWSRADWRIDGLAGEGARTDIVWRKVFSFRLYGIERNTRGHATKRRRTRTNGKNEGHHRWESIGRKGKHIEACCWDWADTKVFILHSSVDWLVEWRLGELESISWSPKFAYWLIRMIELKATVLRISSLADSSVANSVNSVTAVSQTNSIFRIPILDTIKADMTRIYSYTRASPPSLSSSLSSPSPLITLAFFLLLSFSFIRMESSFSPILSVNATNICICECCDGNNCQRDANITIAIGSCSDCTKALCTETYTTCSVVPDVTAKCISQRQEVDNSQSNQGDATLEDNQCNVPS